MDNENENSERSFDRQRAAARESVLNDIESGAKAEVSDLNKAIHKHSDDKPIVDDERGTFTEDEDDGESESSEGTEETDEQPSEDDDETVSDDEEEVEEDEDEDEEEPKAAKSKVDPETQKKLDKWNKIEKQAKERITAERKAFDQERQEFLQEWRPVIEEARKFQKTAARVRVDPAAVLISLGYPEAELSYAARQIHSRSPEAAKDPKYKASADQAMRERELTDRLDTLERRNQELEQSLHQRAQQEQVQQRVNQFIDRTIKAVNDDTPLVQKMITKSPEKARTRIAQTAERLMAETGEIPDYEDVVTALEEERREELKELDVDVEAISPTKQKTLKAGEKKRQKTLSADLRKTTKPKAAPVDDRELRRMLKANLDRGQLEE